MISSHISNSDSDSDSDSSLDTSDFDFVERKKPVVAPKMLLAVDSHNNQHMAFACDQLKEAKEWIWDRYKKCKFGMKDPSDWYVDEIKPGQDPMNEYTLNPEDQYSYEQVKFVNFLILEEYCDEERKLNLLELLEGSEYEISFKKAKRKKQKITTTTTAVVAEVKN